MSRVEKSCCSAEFEANGGHKFMKQNTVNKTIGNLHPGPSLLILSTIYTLLFVVGLIIATRMAGGTTYVSPFVSDAAILDFFRMHAAAVRFQAFVVLASALPLGIYSATISSRLSFLGIRAAGTTIALFGGLGASFILAISGMAQWVLSQHNISASAAATLSWQDFAFMTGGPGYASLLGLLIAGVTVPSYFLRLLPRWVCYWGITLALLGQLSLLSLLSPRAMYFVPLTRLPGFLWLIVCGLKLPRAARSTVEAI
jgi:hypothetical protein